jgi:hypothetical protein
MKALGNCALAVGFTMAAASGTFFGLSQSSWSATACEIGGSFCDRPSLLLVPILATLAWGFMLKRQE